MKLVNFKRFLTFVIGGIVMVFIFISLFNTKSFSRAEIDYIDFTVCSNDTLGEIATNVKNNNINYENKDIREIIYEIKKINNKNSASIYENETLLIPEI